MKGYIDSIECYCPNCYRDFTECVNICDECGQVIESQAPFTPVVLLGNYCPKSIVEEIDYQVARNNLEYASSYRAMPYRALKDNSSAYMRYKKLISCCGLWESSVSIDGHKWIIGCNYGH